MTQQDVYIDGFKQAFEDFLAHEGEFAIAEATRDQESSKRLWIVLYGDGRYNLQHLTGQTDPAPTEVVDPEEWLPHIAFPIEPLKDDERARGHLEDSRFERPLEVLWGSYEQALCTQFKR